MLTVALGVMILAVSASSVAAMQSEECLIEPESVTRLGSQIPGVLEDVLVDRGDDVMQGQVVARLHAEVEAANLGLAKARAESDVAVRIARARARYERAQLNRKSMLYDRNVASRQSLDEQRMAADVRRLEIEEARMEQVVAKLELERARAVLEARTIRSPIAGVVIERALEPGEYISDDQHVLTLARIEHLNVEVFLPRRFYGDVRVGAHAFVFPEPPHTAVRKAVVSVVDPVVDAASGTFGVRLRMPNPGFIVPAGLRCRVDFDTGPEAVFFDLNFLEASEPPGPVED